MHITSRLIYETKQLKEWVKHFYDKILKNLGTGTVLLYFFNASIEADQNVNDLFT